MSVEQDNGWAPTTMANINRCVTDVDLIGREAFEHVRSLPPSTRPDQYRAVVTTFPPKSSQVHAMSGYNIHILSDIQRALAKIYRVLRSRLWRRD